MDTVTLTPPAPALPFFLQPRPRPGSGEPATPRRRLRDARPRGAWQSWALGLLLIVTLLLRLWGVGQGLPYSYNVDEAQHFVPRAISFFSSDLNPHYFLNPPAYTYLLTIVFELWFGSADAVVRAYTLHPASVFELARVLAAVLGTVSVWLTYLFGARFFTRNVGLLAAAILGFAFLPVFYSHLALNDVPAMAPVALSLYGVAGVYRDGRRRDYVIAGAAIGLAAATKYTGGITLICLLAAAGCDARSSGPRHAARWLAAALLAALAAFTLANPYWILDWSSFHSGISSQASLAAGAEPVKLGTSPGGGISYYLWTFGWGLGLVPSLAALAGAAILVWRRRWGLVTIFLIAPVAFIVFMGDQQRYFGRWLLPVFPLVAVLAAFAAAELVRRVDRFRVVPASWPAILVAAVLLVPSAIAVVHDDRVLSRPDTRNLARAWMVGHVPPGSKVVIEPVVPGNWVDDIGRALPWTASGARWYQYATWLSTILPSGGQTPDGRPRFVPVDEYERVLRPALIGFYESRAYCWVLTGSLQQGRAFAQPRAAPEAIAYYRELRRDARLVYEVSPFAAGAAPVPFGFDFSIDYYPRQYRLPGPAISVYHLTGGRCAASA
jgi:hypothetical protein